MKLVACAYYEKFRCKGGACQRNCCIGWEIDIDDDTLTKYEALDGEMGDKIRKSIDKSGEVSHFCLVSGERCPHLDENNLCRIISTLGDSYLCDICREHPRYYTTLGDVVYGGVGMSCEAAAELILKEQLPHVYREYPIDNVQSEMCDEELHKTVNRYRELIVRRAESASDIKELILGCAEFAYGLQGEIDGCESKIPESCDILTGLSELFASLEYMDEGSLRSIMTALGRGTSLTYRTLEMSKRIFIYFVDRYLMSAVCDGDAVGAVGLSLIMTALLGKIIDEGQLSPTLACVTVSSEIEYSEENVDMIRGFAKDTNLYELTKLLI